MDSGESWVELAMCSQFDPEIMFPLTGGKGPCKAAYAVCSMCPVRMECLADSLQVDGSDTYGVRGRMSAGTRQDVITWSNRMFTQMGAESESYAIGRVTR